MELSALDKKLFHDVEHANFNAQVIESLLQQGANPNAIHPSARSVLTFAYTLGAGPDILDLLIRYGADINASHVLIRAALEGDVETIQYLIQRGALINLPNIHGNTALHAAAVNSHPGAVEFLISHGANIYARNRDGKRPLDVATHPETIDYLTRAYHKK